MEIKREMYDKEKKHVDNALGNEIKRSNIGKLATILVLISSAKLRVRHQSW